ncbi:hypothetical protein [Paraburkholderia sediminicola]|uniref:hypothetical protein n=1 Tax=Paraburkholderia sediminicola TaxID=458836 RepID=UPI0038BAA30C
MTKPFNLVDRLQVRAAMFAIGRSTLRSQGAPGMVAQARKFLRKVDLRRFSVATLDQFMDVLEEHTGLLADEFPGKGRGNWGAARKSLNIFLRDVLYSRYLCEYYKLAVLEPWLEVPLDSNVHKGLLSDVDNPKTMVPWPGVKALTAEVSSELQSVALSVAKSLDVARVHLDVRYWRRDAVDELAG